MTRELHAAGVAVRCTTDCWRMSRSGEREVGMAVGWTLPRAPGGQMVWWRFIFRNAFQNRRCGEENTLKGARDRKNRKGQGQSRSGAQEAELICGLFR